MSLPAEFSDLESFVDIWALPTEKQRNARRHSSTMEDIGAFYEVMQRRLDDALRLLADCRPEAVPEQLKPLFYLTLSYCEVAPAVELFKQPSVKDGFDPDRFPRFDIPNMTPPE
jgi:hypothetical protein